MMDRRAFIGAVAGGLAVAAVDAVAQKMAKMFRIAVIDPFPASDPVNMLIRRILGELGYVEGKSIAIEWRNFEPDLASELTQLKLDAIIAIGASAIQVSILSSELNAKRLELLNAAVPTAVRVAVLWDPATGTFHLPALHAEAARLRVALNVLEVRRPEDLDSAFESARAWHAEALNVLASPFLGTLWKRIFDYAAQNRLPAIYQSADAARQGGLMGYGPMLAEAFRQMCTQLDRILKGSKPRDLPVEQPTKFELGINLKTAEALRITIPQSLLLRADEVIQ
jgi:putative ABC transport system substrate-binding protein